MTLAIIETLVETLSGDLILADPGEPDTLLCLQPTLKQIHTECNKLSLGDMTTEISTAQQIVDNIVSHLTEEIDKDLEMLGSIVSRLSASIFNLINTNRDNASDKADLHYIDKLLKDFSIFLSKESQDNSADSEYMQTFFEQLIDMSPHEDMTLFHSIAIACKGYLDSMPPEQKYSLKPVEEGVLLLKSLVSHLKRNEVFGFDYTDVLELLTIRMEEEKNPITSIQHEPVAPPSDEIQKISPDDMEILTDFVVEATESLDSIEVNLIDLEQDPTNTDIINNIFRPFHTIKGVSGFLSLNKMNKLSHTTENLLEAARSGDFVINDIATDVILESVDTLKKLLALIREGTESGFLQSDAHIDVDAVRDKLKKLQLSLTKDEKKPLGEILVQQGNITDEALSQALCIQKEEPERKLGEILIEENNVTPNQVAGALLDQRQAPQKTVTQVKVNTERLDDLVDYTGELVIAQSMLKQKTMNDPGLYQNVNQIGQIVTNIQNIAMSMRMIPIKATFMKMIRIVRDLSKKSGKGIRLNMVGEDTEIDRNVVEALYEPMVHMIRNSCDHGIENKTDRQNIDKPSHGTITLRAFHKGGHIIIEIEDDGRGLDKAAILEKAIDSGLINETEQLTDSEIYNLIMQPGFSTAKEITDVSGRGVGMDVVKSAIEYLRGQLNIQSELGKGTKFIISLPLTLAIIDGMLVGIDEERYVIPTIAIQKAFKPQKEDCYTVKGEGEMIKDRDGLIPVIRLNNMNSRHQKPAWENLAVVVEEKEEKKALLIDELLGKDEYVIKSLGGSLENVDGIAGGAILADGRVGLILDIHGIFKMANR